MNNPQYVHLLVNPEDALIALCVCRGGDKDAIKVSSTGRRGDVYSKKLLDQILSLKNILSENHTYRLYGNVSGNEQIAIFPLSDAVIVEESKGRGFYD